MNLPAENLYGVVNPLITDTTQTCSELNDLSTNMSFLYPSEDCAFNYPTSRMIPSRNIVSIASIHVIKLMYKSSYFLGEYMSLNAFKASLVSQLARYSSNIVIWNETILVRYKCVSTAWSLHLWKILFIRPEAWWCNSGLCPTSGMIHNSASVKVINYGL